MKQSNTLLLFSWALTLLVLSLPILRNDGYLWDFFAYYDSAKAFLHGINPYTHDGLEAIISRNTTLTYVYPPLTIYFFLPFTFFSPMLGAKLFYATKLLALIGLLIIWSKHFLKLDYRNPYTILFFIFAFNATLLWDLYANNITIFEQLGIWLGIVFLLKERWILFSACIIFTSLFKITPLFFLSLLLVLYKKPKWKEFSLACFTFVLFIGLNYLVFPEYTLTFFHEANGRIQELGIRNPSLVALISHTHRSFNTMSWRFEFSHDWDIYIFYFIALVIFLLSLKAILQQQKKMFSADTKTTISGQKEIIYFLCLIYALLLPRYKSYQFVLQLLPALYVLRYYKEQAMIPLAAMLLFIPHHTGGIFEPMASSPLPGPIRKSYRILYEYLPIVATFALWLHFYHSFCAKIGTKKA